MGSTMELVTLIFLSIALLWPLEVIVAINFLLYLGQSVVFPVVVGNFLWDTLNLGS